MQGTIAFLCAVFLGSAAQADAFSDSRGIWMRDDGNAKVSIAPCGQQLCATNLWIGDNSKGEQAGDKLIITGVTRHAGRKGLRPQAKPYLFNDVDGEERGPHHAGLHRRRLDLQERALDPGKMICETE